MRARIATALILGMIVSTMLPISHSYGAERYLAIEKVTPGMTGEAFTVFHGTEIAKFAVKVLAILDSDHDAGKLILVRLEGREIRKCGGLAAGMSGSPVYFNGKLAGALSYGFENADPFLAYVTPIKAMLKLLDKGNQMEYFTYYRSGKKLLPVVTPVIVSGTGRRGFVRLSQSLRKLGMQAVYLPDAGSAGQQPRKPVPVKPGSALAVQLVAGDYQAAALGTVTLVDGKRFLAFGHSFTNQGSVDFLAYQAQIYHIVKSPVLPLKLGGALHPVGRIYEDRHSGIAGCLDQFPAMIKVAVNVKDVERERTFHSEFQVINQERFYRELVKEVATAAVDRALDRVGSGTARVAFKVFTKDNPVPFERENMVYSTDIALSCLGELDTVISAFADNEFVTTQPQLIQIDVAIENRNLTAKVQKLEVNRTKIKPGESINARVLIHPFRGKVFSKSFTVKIPEATNPGKFLLAVRGGSVKRTEAGDNSQKAVIKTNEPLIESFEQQLAGLGDQPKNNELVLELAEVGGKNAPSYAPVRLKVMTDYFLTGQVQQELEIEK